MKTGEDFRREFPEMSEEFEMAAQQTLHELRDGKENGTVKFRPMLVFAAVLVLLMSVGAAATWERWSLTDFINRYQEIVKEADWAGITSDFEPVSIRGLLADAEIREAVYDDLACYMVVEVRLHDPQCFLIPYGEHLLEERAYNAVRTFPKDVKLSEHIASLGYTNVSTLHISTDWGTFGSMEMELNPDGSFVFYLYQSGFDDRRDDREQKELNVQLDLLPTDKHGIPTHMRADVRIERQPVLEAVCSLEGTSYEFSGGLRLSNVRMYRTPLSAYLIADAEITDSAALQDYLYIPRDAEGADLPQGAFGFGGIITEPALSPEDVRHQYFASLALDSLPDEIVLAEMDWRTEKIKDSLRVQLTDME